MRTLAFPFTTSRGHFLRSVRHQSLSLAVVALCGTALLHAESPEEENTIGRRLESSPEASTFIQLLKDTDNSKNLLFDPGQTLTVLLIGICFFKGFYRGAGPAGFEGVQDACALGLDGVQTAIERLLSSISIID